MNPDFDSLQVIDSNPVGKTLPKSPTRTFAPAMRRLLALGGLLAVATWTGWDFLGMQKGLSLAAELSIEDRLYYGAEQLCRQGRFDDAKADLERVLKLNPTRGGALFYMGMWHFAHNQVGEAKKFWEKALKDKDFGSQARDRLIEMEAARKREEDQAAIRSYLDGGAFAQALSSCKEALMKTPKDAGLLFLTIYSAVMAGQPRYAEAAFRNYELLNPPAPEKADLRTFMDGWATKDHAPREALERLKAVTDPRLKTPQVRSAIKEIMLQMQLFDEYVKWLEEEKKLPGIDKNTIDRELVKFYLDQGQFEKGLAIISTKPTDSMPDNLLYIDLLTLNSQERKAMGLVRSLLGMGVQEDALHVAWMKAFLHHVIRTDAPPDGKDGDGKEISEIALAEVLRSRKEGGGGRNPSLMMSGMRIAAVLKKPDLVQSLVPEMISLQLNDKIFKEFLETTKEIGQRGFRSESITILEGALSQRPDDPEIQRELGGNYILDNRLIEATALLEGSLQADPENMPTFLLLIDCLTTSGQTKAARNKLADKLAQPNLNEIFRRQLQVKAAILDQVEAANEAAAQAASYSPLASGALMDPAGQGGTSTDGSNPYGGSTDAQPVPTPTPTDQDSPPGDDSPTNTIGAPF